MGEKAAAMAQAVACLPGGYGFLLNNHMTADTGIGTVQLMCMGVVSTLLIQ
jgi:hypothetical protein